MCSVRTFWPSTRADLKWHTHTHTHTHTHANKKRLILSLCTFFINKRWKYASCIIDDCPSHIHTHTLSQTSSVTEPAGAHTPKFKCAVKELRNKSSSCSEFEWYFMNICKTFAKCNVLIFFFCMNFIMDFIWCTSTVFLSPCLSCLYLFCLSQIKSKILSNNLSKRRFNLTANNSDLLSIKVDIRIHSSFFIDISILSCQFDEITFYLLFN